MTAGTMIGMIAGTIRGRGRGAGMFPAPCCEVLTERPFRS